MHRARRIGLFVIVWVVAGSRLHASGQTLPPDATSLVRQSEVVGFVHALPMVHSPQSTWKQRVYIQSKDFLKGDLERDAHLNNQYPYLWADNSVAQGYPTWFDETGDYLVFLRRQEVDGKTVWATIACFRVVYRPEAGGKVVGRFFGAGLNRTTIDQASSYLASMLRPGARAREAAQNLSSLFRAVASAMAGPEARVAPTHEARFKEAQALAAAIRPGVTRADIEKVLPVQDGGVSGPGSTRYYFGSYVMVEVPFDQTGGSWKPQNRVSGTPRVYRASMSLH
jgi:hypothetical protein